MSAGAAKAVPVLMLHSVAPPEALAPFGWLQSLATHPDLLEASFRAWKRRGLRTITLDELSDHLAGRRPAPKGSLVLTLDDGYVDNWIGLHPLLRAYGFHAVVFASTDFVDPRPVRRAQNVAGAAPAWKGYLSWDEMRAMESDGSVEIHSHARTHTWYFVSDRIVDYYRPATALTKRDSMLRFLWLNEHAQDKPFALDRMKDDSIPWGTPVYEYRPALVARRFHPDPAEAAALTSLVASRGGARFFDEPGWRAALDGEVARRRAGGGITGEAESETAYRARILDELAGSRAMLSEGLGKEVHTLCYPQGAMDDVVEGLAREAGYRMWTMSSWRRSRANRAPVRRDASGRAGANVDPPRSERIYRCGRGYDLFGAGRGIAAQVLSQRVVLARFSGNPWAHLATGLFSRAARVLPGRH